MAPRRAFGATARLWAGHCCQARRTRAAQSGRGCAAAVVSRERAPKEQCRALARTQVRHAGQDGAPGAAKTAHSWSAAARPASLPVSGHGVRLRDVRRRVHACPAGRARAAARRAPLHVSDDGLAGRPYDICAHVEDHTEEFFLDRDVVQDGVHWLLRCIRFDVSLMFGRYSVCGDAPCWTEPMSACVSRGKRRLGWRGVCARWRDRRSTARPAASGSTTDTKRALRQRRRQQR